MDLTKEQKVYGEIVQKAEEEIQVIIDGAELSDNQLEAVSGGKSGIVEGGCILVNFPGFPPSPLPETDPILY